jgi:hypothetical protein
METYLAIAATAPSRNEAVIAAGGAAAALAGLILVFLGAVITGMLAYPGGTPKRLLAPYRRATAAILAVFALSLTSAALSLAWLATGGGGGPLYEAVLWTFFSLLIAAFVVAVWTTYFVVLA